MPRVGTLDEAKRLVKKLEMFGEEWFYRRYPGGGYIVQRKPRKRK